MLARLDRTPIKKERPVFGFLQRRFCLPSTSGAPGCGPGLVCRTRLPACRICCLFTISNIRASHTRGEARTSDKIQSAIALNGHRIRPKGPKRSWWSLSGSNRRPEACKATALPAELRPLTIMVGLGRLERPTSPLSGVRSNHLSYRPQSTGPAAQRPPTRSMYPEKKEKRRRQRPAYRDLTDPLCSKEFR
jgi:hypothetical protein